ncbi:MAG: relaxase/mobilization nuclease domain-containing protein [Clostridia bacterium]
MATTRLIPMHKNQGKTISDCLEERTNYAVNPEKTNDGKLVSSYECDVNTVQSEFMLSKRMYDNITGRKQTNDVIAYQIRQSFKPDEVTAEQANKIGYELALKFTKGNHSFIVATHTDKAHIHNHIIFNSTSIDNTKKFRNFFGSTYAIRKISDRICLENGLSIIENPKKSKGNYGTWIGDEKQLTHSDKIRISIDEALNQNPKSFDEFLSLMTAKGYEVKQGKHTSFKSNEQQRFIRCRSLGDDYSEDKIKAIIDGKEPKKTKNDYKKSVNLLVDIQSKINEGKGAGYQQWAKIYNLKQMAQTINYLRENDLIEYEKLEEKATKTTANFNDITAKIKTAENRMAEIQTMRSHIINYMRTKDVYTAYRKAGYSRKFYNEHESELILHKASKDFFNTFENKKIPTMKSLQAEYSSLLTTKKEAYKNYKTYKKDMQEILLAKENIDRMLNVKNQEKTKYINEKTK